MIKNLQIPPANVKGTIIRNQNIMTHNDTLAMWVANSLDVNIDSKSGCHDDAKLLVNIKGPALPVIQTGSFMCIENE